MRTTSSRSCPRSRLAAVLVISLTLGAVGCGDQKLRAFWADAFSPGFKSIDQIEDMVSRAVAGNYNTIFVEVLAYHDTGYSGHGAYWDSDFLPMASDISGGIDPLATVVSHAHQADLEVHAWIVPYRVSSSWPPSGNTILSAHPEWLMVPIGSMGGGPAKVGSHYTLDPGSPDAQEYLVNIVQELVRGYAIDGVNLDYIRYVQTDAGYPAVSSYADSGLARFRDLTGYGGTPSPSGVSSWNDFRRRTIDEFVRRLRAEIPSIRSNPRQPLRFTADLIAFGDAPTSFTASDAYVLHQNWRHWMEQGWLDGGIPMNYKREYDSSQARWYRNWIDASLDWRYDRHIFAGQGNYLNRKADSFAQLDYALSAGTDGIVTFSYDATADEDMDGTPEADWSWYDTIASALFPTPAFLPHMPWRNAYQADEGTLWGRVRDGVTGAAVDGAYVQVNGVGTVETDGNGYYVVTLIPAEYGGTGYTVSAYELDESETNVAGVLVHPGDVVRQDIDI